MRTALPQRGDNPSMVTPSSSNSDNDGDILLVTTQVPESKDLQTGDLGALTNIPELKTSQQGKSAKTLRLRKGGLWRRRQDPEPKTALKHAEIVPMPAPPQKKKAKRISLAALRARYDIPHRNLATFLGDLPDNRALSDLLLPGTHESLAYYGYPFSQCQSPKFPLESQLENGVRVLDVRLAVVNNNLIAYHGIVSQQVAFTTVLEVVQKFLNAHKTEFFAMSIKQEDFTKTPAKTFSTLVKAEVYKNRDLWYLEDRIPSLGEVRGKIVLFSRFNDSDAGWPNGDQGLGIHPTTWPDNKKGTFDWTCDDTRVETQDWYSIPSFLATPEKFQLAVSLLTQPTNITSSPPPPPPSSPTQTTPNPTLAISFTSAANIPFALPPTVALGFGIVAFRQYWWGRLLGSAGVNERVRDWVQLHLQRNLETELERERQRQKGTAAVLSEKDSDSPPPIEKLGGEEGSSSSVEKVRGWVLMDYVDTPGDLLPLLVECNYH